MTAKIITRKPYAFCQLQYPNGEGVRISMTRGRIKVMKLVCDGFLPGWSIHYWQGADEMRKSLRGFGQDFTPTADPLDAVVECLSRCNSIAEVKQVCAE